MKTKKILISLLAFAGILTANNSFQKTNSDRSPEKLAQLAPTVQAATDGITVTPNTTGAVNISFKFQWMDDDSVIHPLAYNKFSVSAQTGPYNHTIWLDSPLSRQGTISISSSATSVATWVYGYGNFSFTLYAGNDNTQVVDNNNISSNFENQFLHISGGTNITYTKTFTMDTEIGKAMQLSQALIYSAKYGKYLNGGVDLPDVTLQYPRADGGTGASYSPGASRINMPVRAGTTSLPAAYASWDVVAHEYSHFIQDIFGNISMNPGGQHYINTNNADDRFTGNNHYTAKDLGTRLAWAEGWATYNGIMALKYFGSEISSIEYVGDDRYTSYNGVNYSLLDYGYNGSTPTGEANETAVSQILYKLATNLTDEYDSYALGGWRVWTMVRDGHPVRLSDFVQRAYLEGLSKSVLGKLLARFNIAPTNIQKRGGDYLHDPFAFTFSWEGNGGSRYFSNDTFDLVFETIAGLPILRINGLRTTEHTLTWEEETALLSAGVTYYRVYVIGYASDYLATGPYYSEAVTFKSPQNVDMWDVLNVDYKEILSNQYNFIEAQGENECGNAYFYFTYLRAAYITYNGSSYCVLSPRRAGAGTAYMEYREYSAFTAIQVELSLWSESELLRSSDCTAELQYKESDGSWVTLSDLLEDISLPTTRDNPGLFFFEFPHPVFEFRFYLTAPQIGISSNTGRFVIGEMITLLDRDFQY